MPPQPLPLPVPIVRRRLAFRRVGLRPWLWLRSDEGLKVRLFGLELGHAHLRPRTSLSDNTIDTTSKGKEEQDQ